MSIYWKRLSSLFAVTLMCALALGLATGTLLAAEPGDTGTYVPPTQGASDAPIFIIEFADFQ